MFRKIFNWEWDPEKFNTLLSTIMPMKRVNQKGI